MVLCGLGPVSPDPVPVGTFKAMSETRRSRKRKASRRKSLRGGTTMALDVPQKHDRKANERALFDIGRPFSRGLCTATYLRSDLSRFSPKWFLDIN